MVENQSWKDNFQDAFKSSAQLYQFLGWPSSNFTQVEKSFPIFIPKRLAQKIKDLGPSSGLAREFLPNVLETNSELHFDGLVDPIGDKAHMVAPQLIHRYTSRVLFTPTSICPVHCRYCFRKNELSASDELFSADFDQTLAYLKTHPEIRELIFTGGDPLTLSNEKLGKYLEAFSTISSLKDIRFHTRYPVILPERLDQGFQQMLQTYAKKFRTLSLAIHANLVEEFDSLACEKILALSQLDIQLLSQTVLLKGINDSHQALVDLINLFLELKIRPYYLHHPDQVKGGLHFYLPLEQGRQIYSQLRNHLPGWALPQYVIDIPGGAGKVGAYNPENMAFSGQLIGRDGVMTEVQEPDLFSL